MGFSQLFCTCGYGNIFNRNVKLIVKMKGFGQIFLSFKGSSKKKIKYRNISQF